jgi:hypothetical protein
MRLLDWPGNFTDTITATTTTAAAATTTRKIPLYSIFGDDTTKSLSLTNTYRIYKRTHIFKNSVPTAQKTYWDSIK